eukprot:g48966.t1
MDEASQLLEEDDTRQRQRSSCTHTLSNIAIPPSLRGADRGYTSTPFQTLFVFNVGYPRYDNTARRHFLKDISVDVLITAIRYQTGANLTRDCESKI